MSRAVFKIMVDYNPIKKTQKIAAVDSPPAAEAWIPAQEEPALFTIILHPASKLDPRQILISRSIIGKLRPEALQNLLEEKELAWVDMRAFD
jgi:hypothetical protein